MLSVSLAMELPIEFLIILPRDVCRRKGFSRIIWLKLHLVPVFVGVVKEKRTIALLVGKGTISVDLIVCNVLQNVLSVWMEETVRLENVDLMRCTMM